MATTVVAACLIGAVTWTLLAYTTLPLPLNDLLFAWIRRQWLWEGTACLSGVAALAVLASRRSARRPIVPWWTGWCLWIGWAGLSGFYSIDRGLTLRAWAMFASFGLLAYALAAIIEREEDLMLWSRFLVLAGFAVALDGLLQYTTGFRQTLPVLARLQQTGELHFEGWGPKVLEDFLVRKRIVSVFGWPNLYAGFLLLVTPLAAGLSLQARGRTARLGWGAAGLVLAVSLVLTLSMGAWIAAILTGCIFWSIRPRGPTERRRRRTHAAVAGLIIVALLFVTSFMVAKRARFWIASSSSSRLAYVQGALQIMAAHPLAGTGFGTFGVAYRALMPAEGTEGQHTALHAHNTVLQVGAELGAIGLFLFLWAWLRSVARLASQALRPGRAPSATAMVERGLVIGLAAFFIHGILEQTFYESVTAPFWWIGLGLATAGARLAAAPQPDQRPAAPPTGRGSGGWAVAALAAAVLAIALHGAQADLWAAQGALNDLRIPGSGTAWFQRAARWDALNSRYPVEIGNRAIRRADAAASEPERRRLLAQAEEQFAEAVRRSPWLGQAWLSLGLVQWEAGRREAALASVEQAVRRDPNSRAALLHLTRMASMLGAHERAVSAAERLQRLEPLRPDGWLLEAGAREGQGDLASARRIYEDAVRRFPACAPGWFRLAALQERMGATDEALRSYRTFLDVGQGEPAAARAHAEAVLRRAGVP